MRPGAFMVWIIVRPEEVVLKFIGLNVKSAERSSVNVAAPWVRK
jgi:hypothetical protein